MKAMKKWRQWTFFKRLFFVFVFVFVMGGRASAAREPAANRKVAHTLEHFHWFAKWLGFFHQRRHAAAERDNAGMGYASGVPQGFGRRQFDGNFLIRQHRTLKIVSTYYIYIWVGENNEFEEVIVRVCDVACIQCSFDAVSALAEVGIIRARSAVYSWRRADL